MPRACAIPGILLRVLSTKRKKKRNSACEDKACIDEGVVVGAGFGASVGVSGLGVSTGVSLGVSLAAATLP